MELQAYNTIERVYNLMKEDRPLTDKERSYLIGTLETLLDMYAAGDEEAQPKHRTLIERFLPHD